MLILFFGLTLFGVLCYGFNGLVAVCFGFCGFRLNVGLIIDLFCLGLDVFCLLFDAY